MTIQISAPSRKLISAAALLFCMIPDGKAQQVTGPVMGPNGNYYEALYFPTGGVSWTRARNLAEDRTSVPDATSVHLATIGDEQEDVFVESLRQQALTEAGVDPHSTAAPDFWLGGYQLGGQSGVDEGWRWLNGEGSIEVGSGSGYSNWLPGEPNDWPSGGEDSEENGLSLGLRGTFTWNDSGGSLRGLIVEYEVPTVTVTAGPRRLAGVGHFEVVIGERNYTWEEASRAARCRSHEGIPGRLATINTEEQDAFIEQLRLEALEAAGYNLADLDSHPAVWAGGYQKPDQARPDRGWTWINREGPIGGVAGDSGYGNWRANEPNDWPGSGVEDNQENFLSIGHRGAQSWNDTNTPLRGYVVEYSPAGTPAPVDRSTRYSGRGHYEFEHEAGFNRSAELTIECWVYREDDSRREAVISHGADGEGFFLGFDGLRPTFARNGLPREWVPDSRRVPARQWTHVAVTFQSYPGPGSYGDATLYLNGDWATDMPFPYYTERIGEPAPLRLGGTGRSGFQPFRGSIDELRVWSTVRTRNQIRDGMFEEVRGEAGLEAVWAEGGRRGSEANGTGIGSAPFPERRRGGMLPRDLVVPTAASPPRLDGNVDTGREYAGAEELVVRYEGGPTYADAKAYLVHTKEFLYVGIKGARLPAEGVPSQDNVLDVLLDRDGESAVFDEEVFRGQVFSADGLAATQEVVERSIINPITGVPNFFHVWDAANPSSLEFQAWRGTARADESTTLRDVEFRFHRSLLGEFDRDAVDRLALRHLDAEGDSDQVFAPGDAEETNPSTWVEVSYAPAPGDSLPRVPDQWLMLEFNPPTELVTVTWDHIPGLQLSVSADFANWQNATGVSVQDGRATWSGTMGSNRGFFRLERR